MRVTKDYCAAIWNKKFPKNSNYASVTAPGSKNTQLGNRFVGLMVGKTSAKKKRQAYVNYQEIVEKDVDSFERDSEIQYCTYKKCMADYGNEDCSTE